MKFVGTLVLVSSALGTVLAATARPSLLRRQEVDDTCNIQLATSNGGRKVAIVLDSSGSMLDNDPENLRIQAGKALNGQLVTGSNPDVVAVVDFDDSASVIYPLGDPSGAGSSFDDIDSVGGTFIGDGVAKAVGELTKPGNDPTADRSGIVVLTDGEDSDISNLIDEINRAASLGIRVSFGFLAPPEFFSEPDLEAAILKTGGTFMTFNDAANIQPWLFLLLGNGLTASDHNANEDQPLLSGITIAKLSGSDAVTFSYAAQAGEDLVFTIWSFYGQILEADLQDGSGNSIAKNSAGNEPATIEHGVDAEGTLKLVVSSTDSSTEGVFQVNLNSSLGISGCSLPNDTTTTNTTTPPTSPSPRPPVVTAAASKIGTVAFSAVGVLLAVTFF